MTPEEFFKAINDSGLTAERLTKILVASDRIVVREEARSEEAAIRSKAAIVAQEFETAAQEAHARFLEADKATQPQV